MTAFVILILLLAVALLGLFCICYFLVRLMTHPKFYTIPQTIDIEKGKGFLEGYDELAKEDYIVTSFDGYELNCSFIPYPGSKKIVIITHGHSYTRWGSIKYLMMFRKLGYSAVIYDDRGHGLNKPHPISMGFLEKRDLLAVIEDTKKRYGDDCLLGLHGESMGSAISLLVLEYHPPIQFIISDCGYSDLEFFTKMFAKTHFHLPSFVVSLASSLCKLFYGFHISDVSPIAILPENKVPICFIHGAADDFIDPCNAKRMFDADGGYKELHLFENAAHAGSYETNPERYLKIVQGFVQRAESENKKKECKDA